MKVRSCIGLFKDESGSTTITVVLSLVLALAMMASCLQWYWVNTTSTDIQAVADLGALGAAEVIAQSVMIIQTLDAFMLTLNLFGLLLHTVVLVSGTVMVVAGPYGAEYAGEFFEEALKFDKQFCEKRQEIARDVKVFAEALNSVTPLLAYARAIDLVSQNQGHLGQRNQSSYQVVLIPAPLLGTVEMSGDPDEFEQFEDELRDTSRENKESAQKVNDLQDQIEAAIDRCFALDIYKSPQTARAFWSPSFALPDFRTQWGKVAQQSQQAPSDPVPIDDTPSTRSQAAEQYRDYHQRLIDRIDQEVLSAIGPDPLGDAPMTPTHLFRAELTADQWDQTVLLLDHLEGERKAYHARSDCFGLSNASAELREVTLRSVGGQQDHPPCTWCKPPSWKPILMIENDLEPFISAWNAEADAILEYERLRKEVEEEIEATRTRTGATLRELLEKAAAYLAGSRLTYEPSGGRGLWCVVISSSTRSLPDYTLPPLTGADQVELGAQLAIAGARLLPSSSETTLPSFLADATADDSTTAGLGGVVRSLLGDNARIISFGLALWGSCLDLYRQQVSGLYQLSEGLPWGLDTMVEDTIDELLDTAQVNVGDMRRPLPILVSVTEVGKADAGGVEAAMVQTLQGGRSLLEQSGGFSTFGIKEQIREAAQQLGDGLSIPSEVLSSPTIAGIPIWVPFLEELTSVLESPWLDPVGAGIDLLYQLPDLTW